jgi:hypothetical protein
MKSCLVHLAEQEYEAALVDYFPALDKTAKRRRPKDGVGKRIRAFLTDEEALISAVSMRVAFRSITFDGLSFADAIYKFGRTAISHEGELDPRLTFDDSVPVQIGGQTWNLPSSYIGGLCIAVVAAPENAQEYIDDSFSVTVLEHHFNVNELWGAQDRIKELIAREFQSTHLFD